MSCPFCQLNEDRIVVESSHGIVLRDAFPVSPGHTLIVSRRHVSSIFELSFEEQCEMLVLLENSKILLDEMYKPDAFNIGINDGPAAGQTVPHLHIHLIPRYEGDVAEPRGGIRWVMPNKAKYWD